MRREQSLFAGCGEKGGSQPIGLALTRSADGLLDLGEFIRPKSGRDKSRQGFAARLLRSANFSRHAKIVSVTRKLFLQQDNLCVTNIQVLIETALSSEQMAGTAAGESDQANSLPACNRASREESEMNVDTFQVSDSRRQTRSLAVEDCWDFSSERVIPRIRIAGKWLEQAGFKPGHRVEIFIEQPGTLSLRFVEQRKETAL